MALHFGANQYDRNFQPNLLQNWEVPKLYRNNPRAFIGFTQIVANDRGHLLQGVKRSRESPWGNFVGTYDMPTRIPGNSMLNSTARTENATLRLQRLKTEGDIIIHGKLKKCNVPSPLPVKADLHADETVPPKEAKAATNLSANGARSGAQAPEPKSSAEVPISPQAPVKPSTPNLDWPTPKACSAGARVRSATPKLQSPQPLPPIASPKPPTPKPASPAQQEAPKSDIRWPSPKAQEPQPV